MSRNAGRAYVGTSGYIYKHWSDGVFYPKGLPQKRWFEYYAQHFNSVEINNSFYRLPEPSVFRSWHARAPRGFTFFVKGSRFVTHMKKLKEPQEPLRRFFRAVRPLKDKLAGVLWQCPANFKVNIDRLRVFLDALRKHFDGPAVFEFRHESWFCAEVTQLLRAFGAVYCQADMPKFYADLKLPEAGDYVYYRRHGTVVDAPYAGSYSRAALQQDAREMRKHMNEGRTVFAYVNNDIGGHAPRNAATLRKLLARPE